jgi:hypothetical protein
VKVVSLAPLPPGADVVDWLNAGHTIEELLALAAGTRAWSKEDRERDRTRRRLDHQRLRMRLLRRRRREQRVVGDHTAEVLASVITVLEAAQPRSWRQIWGAVRAHGHSRRAVERGLERGVQAGSLAVQGGDRRGQAMHYRLADSSVTRSRTLPHIRSVTRSRSLTGQCPSVPAPTHQESGQFPRELQTVPHSVTLCAGAQGERTSYTLQETLSKDRHSPITKGGTLARPKQMTEHRMVAAGAAGAAVAVAGAKGTPRAVSEDQQQAIAAGHGCGNDGAELRCQLCRWSPTYLPVLRARREAVAPSRRRQVSG